MRKMIACIVLSLLGITGLSACEAEKVPSGASSSSSASITSASLSSNPESVESISSASSSSSQEMSNSQLCYSVDDEEVLSVFDEFQDKAVYLKYSRDNFVEYGGSFSDSNSLQFVFGDVSFASDTTGLEKNYYQVLYGRAANEDGNLNENGDLKDGYVTLLLPVTVTNTSNSTRTYFLNRLFLTAFPKEGNNFQLLEDARYRSKVENPYSQNPDYMKITLQPGESQTYDIGYFVDALYEQYSPLYVMYNDDIVTWTIQVK